MGKVRHLPRLNSWQRAAIVPATALTPRQREICQLVAESKTDSEIAEELGIDAVTVAWHIIKLSKKLGMRRRNVAIITRYAAMKHIIDVEPSIFPPKTEN